MFNLAPVGRFHVQLCGTTPCMMRGSEELKEVCRRMIGEQNHVTPDGAFSWIEVECLGACVNAPMVQINADYYEDLTAETLTRIINDLSAGRRPKPGPQIDRINSAPIGGPTTLTDPALFGANGKPADRGAPSGADDHAKKPGEPANLRDAPMPKPPEGDATDPRRN
jgi:NADH-quinone oxidoreductase subunit E